MIAIQRAGRGGEADDDPAACARPGARPTYRPARGAGAAGGDPRGAAPRRRAGGRGPPRARRGRADPAPAGRPPAGGRGPVQRARRVRGARLRHAGSPRRPTELRDDLCIAMRVYFEKPRTTTGWKGMINDPHLDGSGDVNAGLRMARGLLLEVLSLGTAGGLRVPRPDHPAVHLGRGGLGRDRRPHDREPDPPPARLRPLDARGLQEPHGRQRPGGRGRRARGRGAARLHRRGRDRAAGDRLHEGQPGLPRDPARREGTPRNYRPRRSATRWPSCARPTCPSGW